MTLGQIIILVLVTLIVLGVIVKYAREPILQWASMIMSVLICIVFVVIALILSPIYAIARIWEEIVSNNVNDKKDAMKRYDKPPF